MTDCPHLTIPGSMFRIKDDEVWCEKCNVVVAGIDQMTVPDGMMMTEVSFEDDDNVL